MQNLIPLTRDLVLIGGGHTHALVLRMWAMNPLPGVRVTVIDPGATVAYSGMLPGFVAGHYARDDLSIDLVRLARIAGARVIPAKALGIDPQAKTVRVSGRPPVPYDVASVDIGIHTQMPDLPGFADHAIAAKPLGPFADAWAQFRADPGPAAVIGGGLAGAELAMAMAHALRQKRASVPVHLIDRARVLDEMPERAREAMLEELARQGVTLHEHAAVTRITDDAVLLEDGQIEARFVTGAAGARPYPWLAETGLDTHDGYLSVGKTLQTSDPSIFAAGDCAHLSHAPRPKAGVYAVRAAPTLDHNLRIALQERGRMKPFHPQKDYLKLVSLGGKRALAEKGGRAYRGRLMWRWKNRIDRKFMVMLKEFGPMPAPPLPRARAAGVDAALGGKPMCGGCGAKVGKGALGAVLAGLPPTDRADIEPLPGDDAALLRTGGARQVFTTDHLRAVVDDPVLMTRIAAAHALGDIWAMGAEPQAATAQIILPRMDETLQRRTMEEIMRTTHDALTKAGAAIVGGHSSMGSELTIGFALTGLCEAEPITLRGACPGDVLILTKPIGSGTILAAEMAGQADGDDVVACWDALTQDQGAASRILRGVAHAMTDVTGFGLAGHLWGMCESSDVSAELTLDAVPLLPGALELSKAGMRSTLWADNRGAVPLIEMPDTPHAALLFDPQTSGGLLAAVPEAEADQTMQALGEIAGLSARIGRITEGPSRITVL
ncbi:MAG: selenide, water dikinase SelD [Rhodobacterales bacterium]|nr:MAG: selenide, water dikinase SelD [Rhodobacterales bacterium]